MHGDDITTFGVDSDLDWFRKALGKSFELKVRGRVGEGVGATNDMRILNRVVEMLPDGLTYEADPRHVELILNTLGLTSANAVMTPGIKETVAIYSAIKVNESEQCPEATAPEELKQFPEVTTSSQKAFSLTTAEKLKQCPEVTASSQRDLSHQFSQTRGVHWGSNVGVNSDIVIDNKSGDFHNRDLGKRSSWADMSEFDESIGSTPHDNRAVPFPPNHNSYIDDCGPSDQRSNHFDNNLDLTKSCILLLPWLFATFLSGHVL